MKKVLVSKISYFLFFWIFYVPAIYAVDTTEDFEIGPITNFESYYKAGFGESGFGQELEFVIGGGFVKSFSYNIATGVSHKDKMTEITGVSLGLFWNVVTIENFAFDIMPGFSFDPNKTSKKIMYPDFNAFTGNVDLEFNITPLTKFQPFVLAGFAYSYNHKSGNKGWEIPLALGGLVPIKEGIDFLFQFGWTPTQDATWFETERSISVGMNITAT